MENNIRLPITSIDKIDMHSNNQIQMLRMAYSTCTLRMYMGTMKHP